MRFVCLLTFLMVICPAHAAFDGLWGKSFAGGLAGITGFSSGSSAIFGNPAGLSQSNYVDDRFFASSYYSNYWGLSELSSTGIGAGYCTKYGSLSAGFSYLGKPDFYSEQSISLSYSYSLYDKYSVGLRGTRGQLDQGAYGNLHVNLFDIGAIWEILEELSFAFQWRNFTGNRLIAEKQVGDIESPISIAVELKPADWFGLYAELENYHASDFRLRIGQSIDFGNIVTVNMGINNVPNKFHLGIMAKKFDITVSYSAVFHPDLGMSNHLFLKYN